MKALLWMLALAAIAAAVAYLLQENRGSVVALVPPWRIDVSANFFLLSFALLLWVSFRAGRFVQRVRDFPERVRAYRERRSELSAQRGLREALKALFEGRFARAERAAQRAQSVAPIASLAALVGARAAHRMQEYERRDEWLERAEHDAELATARLVLGAEMATEQRDNVGALRAISQLHGAGARHIHAMRIALIAHLQSGHWAEALRMVRILDKHRGLPAAAARAYRVVACRGLLREAGPDGTSLLRAWRETPAEDRILGEVALDAARRLAAAGLYGEAGRALEESLAQQWEERLVEEYGVCDAAVARDRILRAEGWLRERPGDATLLRSLGRLCLAQRLWGKARSLLEESQRRLPSPETELALARLAEETGEEPVAARLYRSASLALQARQEEISRRAAERSFRREPTI